MEAKSHVNEDVVIGPEENYDPGLKIKFVTAESRVKELEEFVKIYQTLDRDDRALQKKCINLNALVDELKTQNDKLESEKIQLNAELQLLKSEISSETKGAAKLCITRLTRENGDLIASNAQLRNANERLIAEERKLLNLNETVLAENKTLKTYNDQLKHDNERENRKLQSENAKLVAQNEASKKYFRLIKLQLESYIRNMNPDGYSNYHPHVPNILKSIQSSIGTVVSWWQSDDFPFP